MIAHSGYIDKEKVQFEEMGFELGLEKMDKFVSMS